MSNRFYDYLTGNLKDFFKRQNLEGGERFYLQLEEEPEVADFFNSLSQSEFSHEFKYQHEHGELYRTIALHIDGVRIVVAATIDEVKPDFLVTLRNNVSEQKGEWERTALLSICHETLDSIRGGSSDLQREGMPFHVKSIANKLKSDLEKDTTLSVQEKEVLHFHLDRKLKDSLLQPSIWDYEEVLSLLHKGRIDREDFNSLSLFPDNLIHQEPNMKRNEVRKRLDDNSSLFERVQRIHEYGNEETELEKVFDDKIAASLKKESWQNTEFKPIIDSYSQRKSKTLNYKDTETKKLNKDVSYWEKPLSETKAGNRKRHIIIFASPEESKVEMSFEFDDYLSKNYVDNKNKDKEAQADASGKKFNVKLPVYPDHAGFFKMRYKHKEENKSTYEFMFCVLPISEKTLIGIETSYEVKVTQSKSHISINYEGQLMKLGEGVDVVERNITESGESIALAEDTVTKLEVDTAAWGEGPLPVNIIVDGIQIPMQINDKETRARPILAKNVWKLKREREQSFHLVENRLKQGTFEAYMHNDFKGKVELEQKWIQEGMASGTMEFGELQAIRLNLPHDVKEAYDNLLDIMDEKEFLPSLGYLDGDIKEAAEKFVFSYQKEISEIQEHVLLDDSQKGLMNLGFIRNKEDIWMTPFHPLNLSYQLYLNEILGAEEVDAHILDRLHPQNLLPFIYGQGDSLYRPTMESDTPEWIDYKPENQVTVGNANEFMAKVVREKMNQFVQHFDYLFLDASKSPLLLNIIQIHNDTEIVKGVFNYLKGKLEKDGPHSLFPVKLALYRNTHSMSAFESFSILENPEQVEEEFGLSLKSKDYDKSDVLRHIRENISYYKLELEEKTKFDYAHISFFKMPTQDSDALHRVDQIESGMSLDGLLSSVNSIASEADYRSGFGLKNSPAGSNILIETATYVNELAANMKNEASNSYSKNESIVIRTSTQGYAMLDEIYKSSAWVTFIDPGVDLEFFQKPASNLLVIHYSDQYSSSDRYDAITVTDKSDQYKMVIEEYLKEHKVPVNAERIDSAIQTFNAINGEWLLRIIGSKGQFAREKVSIISAMKYAESFFHHENIQWIPVSLEEILRVAGAVNLTKGDGLFSTSNLQSRGKHSDDVLLIGLEKRDGNLYVHFYPIEVKIGGIQNSKARLQIDQTAKLFHKHLRQDEDDSFINKFYRNFFAHILLANAKKLHSNGLWDDARFHSVEDLKPMLLNDDFIIAEHLEDSIGKGAVLTFRKDHHYRSAVKEEDILMLTLLEDDAYKGIVTPIEEIRDKMEKGYFDLPADKLLSSLYTSCPEDPNHQTGVSYEETQEADDHDPIESGSIGTTDGQTKGNDDQEKSSLEGTTPPEQDVQKYSNGTSDEVTQQGDGELVEPAPKSAVELEDIRIPIGKVEGSEAEVHWEFGNPGLANRHMFTVGRSGQGKTYFIQCMLLELAKQGISSIIIDYTDGYKKSQLEEEFKEELGDDLEQFIVRAKKFPVNPFKRNMKMLDEDIHIPEDDSDVAERIKNVIGSIYESLGIQQLNSIYQAVIKGMRQYDEEMSLPRLGEILEEDGSATAKTALSQMNLLIDKNPFDYDEKFDWSFLGRDEGKVFIVQLTGYSPDVQNMITEFILWDLWYYKLQHGNKNKPFPIVLDEMQRLDMSGDAPTSKILTEGRKFGWSGWFATQFTKGFASDHLSRLQNAAQKIYFNPTENEISSIAATFSQDTPSRKQWEEKLKNLKKGQCVVYGPVLGKDGELKGSMPVVVNISSMKERL
ncbi:DNA phosphorothioation-dependent restriction protein DptH [Halobacillus aidingensis]|nr:DNA phosphorothioation-dependent restriction protein DptH [Halobacillus aidingensis]